MKKLILGLGGCGNNIINLLQDKIDDSFKTLSVQKDLQLLSLSNADFKLDIKDKNFEEKLNTIVNFSKNISIVAGFGGSTLFLYIEILLKIIKDNKKIVKLFLTTPNVIEGTRRINLSNQTKAIIENKLSIYSIFKNDKILSETDNKLINQLFNHKVSLLEIIERIENEKWCFQYGGACGTCGMKDVKNYIKQFEFEEIISLYENLDYDNLYLNNSKIVAIKKIYSLLTSNYTIYNNNFNFVEFEEKLIKLYPNSEILKSLILSNNDTYWKKWKEERNKRKQLEFEEVINREILLEKQAMMASKDKRLQNSEYRKNLIENLKSKDINYIIKYLAEDEEHTIKFYPSILVVEAEENLNKFNKEHLRKILDKLSLFDARKSPWKRFKRKLRWYLNGKEWYET